MEPRKATVLVAELTISILQPSVLLQVTSYTHIYCFDESGIHTGTGECCKPLGHLKEHVNELRTIFLHINLTQQLKSLGKRHSPSSNVITALLHSKMSYPATTMLPLFLIFT